MINPLQETQFLISMFLFIGSILYLIYLIQELPYILEEQMALRTPLTLPPAPQRQRRIGTAVIDKPGPSLRLGPRVLDQLRTGGAQTTEQLLEALQARDPYVGQTSLQEEIERLFVRGKLTEVWSAEGDHFWSITA